MADNLKIAVDSLYEPVSIVVVNYNAGSLLLDCITSGLKQAREVVVIDNASSDGSVEVAERHFLLENRLKMIRSKYGDIIKEYRNKGVIFYINNLNKICKM